MCNQSRQPELRCRGISQGDEEGQSSSVSLARMSPAGLHGTDKTVAAVRQELIATSEIPKLDALRGNAV